FLVLRTVVVLAAALERTHRTPELFVVTRLIRGRRLGLVVHRPHSGGVGRRRGDRVRPHHCKRGEEREGPGPGTAVRGGRCVHGSGPRYPQAGPTRKKGGP